MSYCNKCDSYPASECIRDTQGEHRTTQAPGISDKLLAHREAEMVNEYDSESDHEIQAFTPKSYTEIKVKIPTFPPDYLKERRQLVDRAKVVNCKEEDEAIDHEFGPDLCPQPTKYVHPSRIQPQKTINPKALDAEIETRKLRTNGADHARYAEFVEKEYDPLRGTLLQTHCDCDNEFNGCTTCTMAPEPWHAVDYDFFPENNCKNGNNPAMLIRRKEDEDYQDYMEEPANEKSIPPGENETREETKTIVTKEEPVSLDEAIESHKKMIGNLEKILVVVLVAALGIYLVTRKSQWSKVFGGTLLFVAGLLLLIFLPSPIQWKLKQLLHTK